VNNNFIIDKINSKGANNLTIVEHISFFTGISQRKLLKLLEDYSITELEKFLHVLDITDKQKAKLKALFVFSTEYKEMLILKKDRILRSPDSVGEYFVNLLGNLSIEKFYAVFLNSAKKVIKTVLFATGNGCTAIVFPRMIVEKALLLRASSVIIGHNHTSDSFSPSGDDISTTHHIQNYLRVLDIDLDDHIIVADRKYYSFFENGIL
jgi:DNA repair protein RadC